MFIIANELYSFSLGGYVTLVIRRGSFVYYNLKEMITRVVIYAILELISIVTIID